jgi:hypothetical protein
MNRRLEEVRKRLIALEDARRHTAKKIEHLERALFEERTK